MPEGVRIAVQDREAAAGGDALSWTFIYTLPSECPAPAEDVIGPLSSGAITVTDAQPSSVRRQARPECIFIRAAHGRAAFRAWYGRGAHHRHAMGRCVDRRSND
ncbi:MAG: hypothetical protein JW895_07515 [Thermoleophilaceae bacterium]|nr:hypothetical protein [Thermoleophilaceae bacterium]